MALTVRSHAEFDDLEQVRAVQQRVDDAAFGEPANPAQATAKAPLMEPGRWYLAELDGEPCGVAGSFGMDLTVPGGVTVPVGAVSDVGVLPTHRRRGVLGTMLRRQLDDLAAGGDVAAVLHASEAAIYRRFGFGAATRWRQVSMRSERAAFRDDWPDPGGTFQVVAREDASALCASVHEQVRRARPGGLSRSGPWWSAMFGDVELYLGGGRRLVIVHRDRSGTPDGYVIYRVRHDWTSGQAASAIEVWELLGVDHAVELALWRTMLDHDLIDEVSGPIAIDHALFDVLVDPRQARTLWEQDLLWARLLDIPAALAARTYAAQGRLRIEVHDEVRPQVAGTFDLESAAGSARCTRVGERGAGSAADGAADLVLDVADLGACWLGGTSLRRLVRAGRVREARPGAAAFADAMFTVDPAPWCWVRF